MDPRHSKPSSTEQSTARHPERRTKARTHLHLKADVTLPGDLTIVGHTLDVSASGMSLEVPYRLEPGQRCEIELNLSEVGGPSWVQVVGEVRRCVEVEADIYQAGLQFVDLSAPLMELLDTYVYSRLAHKSN